MAIVLRLSFNSSCSSSSSSFSPLLLSSSSPLSNTTTTQLGFSRNQKLDRRICSVLDSSSPSCSTAVAVAVAAAVTPLIFKQRKERSWKIQATVSETDEPKWWQRNTSPNMLDIHSTEDFLTALSEAGDKLVVAEFYGTWCGSCRALFPKLCKTAKENPDILFLKVDFDENKPMCKSLNVKVLPFFHFYRGADGLLDAFSCSLAKFQKIKDAIATHNTARCSIGPPKGVGDIILTGPSPSTKDKPAELSSR